MRTGAGRVLRVDGQSDGIGKLVGADDTEAELEYFESPVRPRPFIIGSTRII
jgi:hypothetical protein